MANGREVGGVTWWVCGYVCTYVSWRELSTQHGSPAGVTVYLRATRAAAWAQSLPLPLRVSVRVSTV